MKGAEKMAIYSINTAKIYQLVNWKGEPTSKQVDQSYPSWNLRSMNCPSDITFWGERMESLVTQKSSQPMAVIPNEINKQCPYFEPGKWWSNTNKGGLNLRYAIWSDLNLSYFVDILLNYNHNPSRSTYTRNPVGNNTLLLLRTTNLTNHSNNFSYRVLYHCGKPIFCTCNCLGVYQIYVPACTLLL